LAQAQREGRIYDYEEEIYGETGLISNTNLSVTGGGEKTTFFIGANVRDEEGIIKGTGYERNTIRTNIEHKINRHITLSSNSNYINSTARRGFTGNENDGGLSYGYNLAFTRPWAELHPNEFGVYPANPYASGNPLFVRDRTENEETTNRFIQGLKLQANLLSTDASTLKLVLNGGLDYFMNETYVFVPKEHQAQEGVQNGFLGVGKNEFQNINTQGFLVWDNYLNDGEIVLTSQAGVSYLNFNRDLTFNMATQLLPGPPNLSLAGAQEIDQTLQTEEEFGMVFQQEANFGDKLIGTLGIRADKSSLNGNPNQYYYFPKASLAWNIANYDFWNVPAINQFKLRAAYGQTGSSAAFGSLYTSFVPVTVGGEAGIIIGGNRGNQDLEPETAAEMEFGLDMSFFDSKLGFEATYYNRNVDNLILERGLPSSSGYSIEVANLADLQNQGFELAIHAQPVTTSSLKWLSQTNFWLNRSEITRLAVPAFPVAGSAFGLGLGTFYIEEGQPITQIKGTVDGEVVTVGNVEPDFQMSFYNQLNILNNFDFNFLLHWKEGGNNLNLTRYLTDLAKLSDDLDTPEGQERINTVGSLRFIEDASYVRLREVALYYNVPKETVLGLAGNVLSTIRVGVSGRNLLTFTNYSSYDPEVSVKGGAGLSSGAEVAPFPSTKQAFFHLSLGF
jgi:outer membrane receptor protein involved in Fe transport